MEKTAAIETGKNLTYENVASFRSKLPAQKINHEVEQFVKLLQDNGLKKSGPMISATHSAEVINGEYVLDVEFLVPVDRTIELNAPYRFLEKFHLTNCLLLQYCGDPSQIQESYNVIQSYITNKQLQPVTSVYNVNVNEEPVAPTIELYVSVTENRI